MTTTNFPDISAADWHSLVARTIEGRDPATLAARSDDGLAIGPIYAPDRATPLPWRSSDDVWQIVQRIDRGSTAEALAALKADSEGGVACVALVFDTSPAANGAGLSAASAPAIAGALNATGCRVVRVDAGEETPALSARLRDALSGDCEIVSDFDPVAALAARGFLLRSWEANADSPGGSLLADGRVWHAGGATEAQELAAVLGTLAEFHRLLSQSGRDDELTSVGLALAADADQFMTIAKFRAIRLLHARFLEVAGLPQRPTRIHAETAWRMMSRLDPHTNILRVTSAVFAAGIGGADSIAALPFDAALGGSDPFARRIARNSQSILLAESGLGHVADPGAGSGAIELLSRELAARAWDLFRTIEKGGGILGAVRSGTIQAAIAVARDERLARVRRKEIELTGVNVYRNPAADTPPPLASPAVAIPGAAVETAEPLRVIRLAEAFEEAA